MLGFLFGIVVGAAGYWAYRFWKGEGETTWDQSFSSGSGSSSYGGYSSEPVGSGTTSGTSGTESSGTSMPS